MWVIFEAILTIMLLVHGVKLNIRHHRHHAKLFDCELKKQN